MDNEKLFQEIRDFLLVFNEDLAEAETKEEQDEIFENLKEEIELLYSEKSVELSRFMYLLAMRFVTFQQVMDAYDIDMCSEFHDFFWDLIAEAIADASDLLFFFEYLEPIYKGPGHNLLTTPKMFRLTVETIGKHFELTEKDKTIENAPLVALAVYLHPFIQDAKKKPFMNEPFTTVDEEGNSNTQRTCGELLLAIERILQGFIKTTPSFNN